MRFNIKSKKGFTLIELLVVIGILAVLAAIAIPSVAGLIDRANVSADKTNTTEYTNAIERFTSEYELYCQDIASGVIKDVDGDGTPDNLDSAQGRVYNVIKVFSRTDIEHIEKSQDVGVFDVGSEVAIYRDTKYPINLETLKSIVKNYSKTSSSTFEPKQSDCCYYYAPSCGVVVCLEKNRGNVENLNLLIPSHTDVKGNQLNSDTQWINLTTGYVVGYEPFDISLVSPNLEYNNWATIQKVIQEGKISEAGWKVGDTKTLKINGMTATAMIIGIDHDGTNTVTFMLKTKLADSGMNPTISNKGGWEASQMRTWLNGEIFNTMDNRDYIKEVMKRTNNVGKNGTESTSTYDKLFLLSVVETARTHEYALNDEGSAYEYFANGGEFNGYFWTRTPSTSPLNTNNFLYYHHSSIMYNSARVAYPIYPAFVIG